MSTLFETNPMKINNILPQDNKFTKIVNNLAKPPKRLYFIGKLPEKRVPAVAGDELQTESGVSASEFSKTLTFRHNSRPWW
jgi:hypothetical protein